jgi:hypothetical protein
VLWHHLQRQAPRQLARERRGLASFGFADLEYAMCFNCALAWHCPYGYPGLMRVCDKIIEAKGCIVPDKNFRTGRRARKIHGEGECKTKLRKRERKSTYLLRLSVNPALKGAYCGIAI